MSRQCGKCGALVPAGASFFCNKCGARLPAEGPAMPLTCPRCKKTITDRLSQFCDRCGTPLAPAVQPPPPVLPVMQVKDCPRCGFGNLGTDIYYCKKCGTSLGERESRKAPGVRSQDSPALTRNGSRDIPPRGTVARAAEPREVPGHRQKTPREGILRSHRKALIGVAVVILILIAVAFILTSNQGIPGAGPANSSATGLLAAPVSGGGPASTSAPVLSETQPSGSVPGGSPEDTTVPGPSGAQPSDNEPPWVQSGNHATAVVEDTPLNPEK